MLHGLYMDSPYGPGYQRSRQETLSRSGGVCQLCGQAAASETHHWAAACYPTDEEVTPDDLIALCSFCHYFATEIRRFTRYGGSRFDFQRAYKEAINSCGIPSKSRESLRESSNTTERPDWTGDPLPIKEKAGITSKKGKNKTETDDIRLKQLEVETALWLDEEGKAHNPGSSVSVLHRNRRQKGEARPPGP